MWTCPLLFCGLKSLPKNAYVLQQQYFGHFSFMPCQLACSCMGADQSRISCRLGSSHAARCFSLSISRPTHPCMHLLPAFLRCLPFCLIPPIFPFALHSRACHFCRSALALCSTSRWCGLSPSCFTSPALLHLLSGAPLAKNGCSTTILLSRSSGPSA